jgi:hypothetical protein
MQAGWGVETWRIISRVPGRGGGAHPHWLEGCFEVLQPQLAEIGCTWDDWIRGQYRYVRLQQSDRGCVLPCRLAGCISAMPAAEAACCSLQAGQDAVDNSMRSVSDAKLLTLTQSPNSLQQCLFSNATSKKQPPYSDSSSSSSSSHLVLQTAYGGLLTAPLTAALHPVNYLAAVKPQPAIISCTSLHHTAGASQPLLLRRYSSAPHGCARCRHVQPLLPAQCHSKAGAQPCGLSGPRRIRRGSASGCCCCLPQLLPVGCG